MMTKNRFFSLNEARRFLALGLPVLVTQIAQMGMNFVDTAMTGQASTADMAAVAVSGSIWVPVSLLGMGCLLSLPAMMAHLVGGGEQQRTPHLLRQGLWLSSLLSLVLMVSVLACGASAKTSTKVRIAGLKGPTTMGLVNLLSMEKDGTASLDYDLQLYGAADEIVPKLIKGELDMAAIPANLAATLYQKTNGGIQVMAVNTLGVLYVVEKGNTVHSFADLKGRTILSTGKGTTPEYVLRYLLKKNGLDPDKDVKIEYYSEASEVTAQMAAARKDAIAVLPQPYVTAAQMKDSGLRVVLDLTREWNKVCDTQLITGVTVVRTEYAKQNPNVIAAFLTDYQKSVKAANEDIDGTAALCEEVGVVAKAAIAKKALPKCNIVYRNGQEMKKDISAYLQVLYDASPAAVGGKLPDDNFYYTEPSVLRKVMAAIRNSAK